MVNVYNDLQNFFQVLNNRYGIYMYQNGENRVAKSYLGEFYSPRGESFIVNIVVMRDKTNVFVYNVTGGRKVGVFQKSYSTGSNNGALSKSVSLFNFLDRICRMG